MNQQYQTKQRHRYNTAKGDAAYDAIWRAASEADLLQPHETSQEAFTPARVAELTRKLGWG